MALIPQIIALCKDYPAVKYVRFNYPLDDQRNNQRLVVWTCSICCTVQLSWVKTSSITWHPKFSLILSVSVQTLYLTALKIPVILVSYYTVILVLPISTFLKRSREYILNLLAGILMNQFSRQPGVPFNQLLFVLWTDVNLEFLWETPITHFGSCYEFTSFHFISFI